MKALTPRQRQVLEFIEAFVRERGYSPSVRDIAARFGLVSAAGVHKHIKALVRKGYLSKEALLSRSLRVTRSLAPAEPAGPAPALVELPLAGYVAAGQPIEAIEQQEAIAVPSGLLSRQAGNYVLRVRGESMIEEYIQDGDYVVMEPRDTADNGEMVVALINGQEATLKRFYRDDGTVRLQPANPAMEPIVLRDADLRIQGVVVGIWRRYR